MEDTLRIPVVCPACGMESLTALSSASIEKALDTRETIILTARCHDKAWQASSLEREQLRQYLEAARSSGARV